jgi:hypothetical protein
LLKGVQNLFKGAVELFQFRWRRKKKDFCRKKVKKQRLLFPEIHPNISWMRKKIVGRQS